MTFASVANKLVWFAVSTHFEQVAQVWQRDRAKLALFSINVQLYSHKSTSHRL